MHINFKRKYNINRKYNIYINIYNILPLIYKRKCNKQPTRHDIKWYVYTAFASLGGVFPSSPLNILHTFFCLSALSLISPCSLPAAVCRLRASLRLSSDPPARCVFRGCCASPAVFCCVPFRLPVPVPCSVLCVCAPEALRRPSACPVVCVLSCVSCLSVTRQPSGARRCGSVGRCTAYMSPALPPLAYVLPWLVPCVCLCVCPAACCRLVAIIGGTPLYPGRRLCGAASAMWCCFCLWLYVRSGDVRPSALIAPQRPRLRPSCAL